MIVFELKRTEGSFNGIIAYMANFVKGFWAKKCEVALLGNNLVAICDKVYGLVPTWREVVGLIVNHTKSNQWVILTR